MSTIIYRPRSESPPRFQGVPSPPLHWQHCTSTEFGMLVRGLYHSARKRNQPRDKCVRMWNGSGVSGPGCPPQTWMRLCGLRNQDRKYISLTLYWGFCCCWLGLLLGRWCFRIFFFLLFWNLVLGNNNIVVLGLPSGSCLLFRVKFVSHVRNKVRWRIDKVQHGWKDSCKKRYWGLLKRATC